MEEMYYEIEYDSCPYPGVGKFVQKSREIQKPEKDEIRELFGRMRDIARTHRAEYDFSRFFERRGRNNEAEIFYKQGMFMKDYEDDYSGNTPFSQYYPCYQMMGYEQLRTYFTWRTLVRRGDVKDTSLSYAFLYIYELLGNIGTAGPKDGLDKLMSFWKSFRIYNSTIDKYVPRWLKEYHIYYGLPHQTTETDDADFNLFCAISKYDIRKSAFFTDETRKMITDCFSFVVHKLRQDFEAAGINFDDALFRPTRKIVIWKPFRDAIFYTALTQPDRRVVLSENEIYICRNDEWITSTSITTEKGKQFIGYVMKKTEAVLREITKYRFKITANTDMMHEETIRKLTKAGLFADRIVSDAVREFYKEATKTVVKVDHTSLARIRYEAQATQEALFVPDRTDQNIFADHQDEERVKAQDTGESFKDMLNEIEISTLDVLLQGGDLKAFADEKGVMLEVLVDGINEKAADYLGDNLIDENYALYDDYIKQVEELIK